ncbi:hypothetical protein BO82DRAFT_428802 [Aspergillus uvarum CBS 121591]|uniref:Uncharacterized protein n=1 Tax=Aspergillus uvarum CBS 121591 TaxID=1448315 RepID=A0A319CP14_9EURO|nr:hypothetical protein BO82DRAFT_428802 [Aspergillus uvarum CBS 121591]PYH85801.1 hypothetical protein BO82DRAFT_428802 [Aspergillus uvarum CBS 121591]
MVEQTLSPSLVEWLDQLEEWSFGSDIDDSSIESITPLGASLEDLLQSNQSAASKAPECTPLPASRSSSSASSQDATASASTGSLRVIARCDTPVVPLHIPLPKPQLPLSKKQKSPRQQQHPLTYRQRSAPALSYEEMLDRAAQAYQIKNGKALGPSRLNKTSIIYYDYLTDDISDLVEIRDSKHIARLEVIPPEVRQRVLLVEDLSRDTIYALRHTFRVNPEVFEEHLLSSGYSGADYDDAPALQWKTAPLKRSHMKTSMVGVMTIMITTAMER